MKFKSLEQYRTGGTRTKMQLSIPVPLTPDGRAYRYSPNEHAHPRHFVIGERVRDIEPSEQQLKRMRQAPGSTNTVCPCSGTIAADEEFTHPADIKAARDMVAHAALEDMKAAIGAMFEDLSRRSSSKNIIFKAGKSQPKPKPRFGRKDLMRELVCDHCGRDYGVFAIALFCPDCGAPNLRLHFEREVELVGKQVDLADTLGIEQEEFAFRLLGNAHEDVLTAFEATLKAAFAYGVSHRPGTAEPVKEIKNDFQNVDRGRARFEIFTFDLFGALSPKDLATLKLNIQKRHVIGHNLGVVDAKFAAMANDSKLGETVALVGKDIRAFAVIAQKVIDGLDQWLVDLSPLPQAPQDQMWPETETPVEDNETVGSLGALGTRIGRWLCEHSDDGSEGPIRDDETLQKAFEEVPTRELEDAIAELEAEGFIGTTHFIGPELPHISLKAELFMEFDPLVHGTNPANDAADLAERVLQIDKGVDVAKLHAETGWTIRRFNPAISQVLAYIDEGRISQVWGIGYPARSFFLAAEDRVELRRFLKRIRG